MQKSHLTKFNTIQKHYQKRNIRRQLDSFKVIKDIYKKPKPNIVTNDKISSDFLLISETRYRFLFIPLLYNVF